MLIKNANAAHRAEKKYTITEEDEEIKIGKTYKWKKISAYDVDAKKQKDVEYLNGEFYSFFYVDNNMGYTYDVENNNKSKYSRGFATQDYVYFDGMYNWRVEGSAIVVNSTKSGTTYTYKFILTAEKKYHSCITTTDNKESIFTATTTFEYGVADVEWPTSLAGSKEDY
jgi:hypothetical protein